MKTTLWEFLDEARLTSDWSLVARIPGEPVQKGSKNSRVQGGRAVMYEQATDKQRAWRPVALDTLERAMIEAGHEIFTGPVLVVATFAFRRPKLHHVASDRARPLKADAPLMKTGRPDLDKLLRMLLDALTGTVIFDDSQVVQILADRTWDMTGYTSLAVYGAA